MNLEECHNTVVSRLVRNKRHYMAIELLDSRLFQLHSLPLWITGLIDPARYCECLRGDAFYQSPLWVKIYLNENVSSGHLALSEC